MINSGDQVLLRATVTDVEGAGLVRVQIDTGLGAGTCTWCSPGALLPEMSEPTIIGAGAATFDVQNAGAAGSDSAL